MLLAAGVVVSDVNDVIGGGISEVECVAGDPVLTRAGGSGLCV